MLRLITDLLFGPKLHRSLEGLVTRLVGRSILFGMLAAMFGVLLMTYLEIVEGSYEQFFAGDVLSWLFVICWLIFREEFSLGKAVLVVLGTTVIFLGLGLTFSLAHPIYFVAAVFGLALTFRTVSAELESRPRKKPFG